MRRAGCAQRAAPGAIGARCLREQTAPAWVFLRAPQHAASATAIRASKGARAIAKPPKPFSPARHRAAPRKKVAKPTLARRRQDARHAAQEDDRRRSANGRAARRSRKAEPSALERLQSVIVGSLEDDKAENVVTLDLAGKATFCDRMVIATGLADRQITAMAEHLSEKLHEAGLKRVQVEGAGGADWVLIDAGDIVVHLFKPEARAMYALEKMWGADLDEAV